MGHVTLFILCSSDAGAAACTTPLAGLEAAYLPYFLCVSIEHITNSGRLGIVTDHVEHSGRLGIVTDHVEHSGRLDIVTDLACRQY